MISKIRKYANTFILTSGLWLFNAKYALAQEISEQTAESVSQKVVSLVSELLLPFGGAVIFIAVVIAALKIILTANKPNDRAEAISSLPYILGGGVLLGGAMIVAGFIVGLWSRMQ